MRQVFIVISLILICSAAFAITIQPQRNFLARGDELNAAGQCSPGTNPKLEVMAEGIKIVESTVDCSNGQFAFSYKTTFLDPDGKWTLNISDNSESSSAEVLVDDAREAGFFLIRFLSPTPGKYVRTEKISLSVEISDSGEKVDDANVAFFGFGSERQYLVGVGNGIYTIDYEIPADADLGSWKLEVFATAPRGQGNSGGRNQLDLEIEKPPLKLQVVEPSVSSVEVGDEVKLNLVATYFNGNSLQGQPIVVAQIDGIQTRLIKTAENTFEGKFNAPSTQTGTLEIAFNVEDGFGNDGATVQKIVVGCSITCLARNYGIFVLLALVIAAAAVSVFYAKIHSGNELAKMQEERQKTLEMIRSLQSDYFTKGVMPSSSYKRNLSDYKARLAEIDQKIAELKSKKETE